MKHLALALCLLLSTARAGELGDQLELGSRAYIEDITQHHANAVARDTMATFNRVQPLFGIDIKFYVTDVVKGGISTNEAMVVDISLEIMSEAQRTFIIAHEFGHLQKKHYDQRVKLVESLVPGDLGGAEARAALKWVHLRPELKEQAWEFESQADLIAGRTMLQLGFTKDDVLQTVRGFKQLPDSQTHPSTARRYSRLLRDL